MSVTETFPSWYLGHNPYHRVIVLSYNEVSAKRFGSKNIAKIKKCGKLFGIKLRTESATDFELTNGVGAMISRGLLSGVTGNPAELMIIDDPVKNAEEADSPTMRNKIVDEWMTTFKSRLASGAKVIVIQTRWRYNDFAGYLILNEPYVKVINIPCEAEENDPLGREVGEPLAPELGKGKQWLEAFKQSYMNAEGLRAWHSLYQGKPSQEKGNIFQREWFVHYQDPPGFAVGCISVDASFKNKETSDYVAIQAWGKSIDGYYLLRRVRRQMGFIETVKEVLEFKSMFPDFAILVEDKANGSAIIEMLRLNLDDVIEITPRETKVARAQAVSPLFENKVVKYPYSTESVYFEELTRFPFAEHDDETDATTQALNWLKGRYAGEASSPVEFRRSFGVKETEELYLPY